MQRHIIKEQSLIKKMKLGTWAVYLMQEFKVQGFHRGERKQTHDSGRS